MSVFDDIDMTSQGVIDDVFADEITIFPQLTAGPNYGGGGDTSRPQNTIRGAIARAPTARPLQVSGKAAPGVPVNYTHTEVWVSAGEYSRLGYELAERDLVDLGDGVRKVIIDVRGGDHGDVVLIIGR